jgi:hypothetical protein
MPVITFGLYQGTMVGDHQVTNDSHDRPADDNPRRGLPTEAGMIQLMAYDPQPAVEFRSVRVGDLGDPGPGGH